MIFEKKIVAKYQQTLLTRHDPDGILFYFSKEDFPGLCCDEHSFTGDKGQRLSAYLYYKGEPRTDRIIVFDHGMGNGHVAYMQEINVLCDGGYTVFTYDHTGTRCSEGEHIGGFSQSLSDLDKAIKYVKAMPEYQASTISVIGHSWGGFSTMNIPAIHPQITHVVSLSGFTSPKAIQEQVLTGFLKFYRKAIYAAEREAFPKYAKFNACTSLKNTKTKALIIHSRDDAVCLFDNHFEELRRSLAGNQNVAFLAVDGKGHNPNYTAEAVRLKDEMTASMKDKIKQKKLETEEEKAAFQSSWDWKKITEQDMDVWGEIFKFLKK